MIVSHANEMSLFFCLFTEGNRWNSSNSNNSKSHRTSSSHDGFGPGQVLNNSNKHASNAWSTGSSNVPPPLAHTNELKLRGMDAISKSGIQLEQVGLNSTPSLDAAQRKTLPAWIR